MLASSVDQETADLLLGSIQKGKHGGREWESNPPIHLHGQAGFEDQ